MNISQLQKLLNILGIQMISKKWKLMFRYFTIRNSQISRYRSFYISSFKILIPTHA